MKQLIRFWNATWQSSDFIYPNIYQCIIQHYQEHQRYYHTTQHLLECLQLWQEVQHLLHQPQIVALALWFHDVIYQPQANDNEEQSAVLAEQMLASTDLTSQMIEKITQYILATKNHQNHLGETDLDFLLDIDLAILASDGHRFKEYERQIRQEYIWVDENWYKIKRRKVLQHFYQQDRLFQTQYFYEKYEIAAKNNLLLFR